MLALDGHCKTLDAAADGYVRAEACIAMLLTSQSGGGGGPSTAARQPNGVVVLRSTYVNQDGRSSSLTAPNGPSQQQVRICRTQILLRSGPISSASQNHAVRPVLDPNTG